MTNATLIPVRITARAVRRIRAYTTAHALMDMKAKIVKQVYKHLLIKITEINVKNLQK